MADNTLLYDALTETVAKTSVLTRKLKVRTK